MEIAANRCKLSILDAEDIPYLKRLLKLPCCTAALRTSCILKTTTFLLRKRRRHHNFHFRSLTMIARIEKKLLSRGFATIAINRFGKAADCLEYVLNLFCQYDVDLIILSIANHTTNSTMLMQIFADHCLCFSNRTSSFSQNRCLSSIHRGFSSGNQPCLTFCHRILCNQSATIMYLLLVPLDLRFVIFEEDAGYCRLDRGRTYHKFGTKCWKSFN